MCVVSNVYDYHYDKWKQPQTSPPPQTYPLPNLPAPNRWPWGEPVKPVEPGLPSKEDIEDFKRILRKAREWDIEHNEPDCESADKKRRLQELADELGIPIDFPE